MTAVTLPLVFPNLTPAPTVTVEYGEVFTRRWVVDLILDLCEYRPDRDLTQVRVAEPSVGSGAFWVPIVERLIEARTKHQPELPWADLGDVLRGWDLQPQHIDTCRELTTGMLIEACCDPDTAAGLSERWLSCADFLLTDRQFTADLVVGNPPYIRIEDLNKALLAAYRKACPTMGGRADIFIGFFEHALDMLAPEGCVGYICADRWMRNQYGQKLRSKIVRGKFAVDVALTMHDADAFAEEVSAYPAITILRRGQQQRAVVANAVAGFGELDAVRFAAWATGDADVYVGDHVTGHRVDHWHQTAESWAEGSPALVAWLADIEARFPSLEATGAKVGIGVATGRDAVYIVNNGSTPDVEPDRLLPLLKGSDINSGTFEWGGSKLVNPWNADGLVNLTQYPKLAAYYEQHKAGILGRNVSKKNPDKWWRTIDRVNHALLDRPMLVMSDMTSRSDPVLVPAGYYPHHNLYWITSDRWNLEVLGGLLLSNVVERQVAAYCVKMRGGTLRFQAQYLRRVHLPNPDTLTPEQNSDLIDAFRTRDRDKATDVAMRVFGLQEGIPD